MIVSLVEVLGHELGGGGVEGWTSRESPAEDPGDGGPTGQTEEGKDTEAVSAGLSGSCPAETEAEGQFSHGVSGFVTLTRLPE